MAAKGSTAKSEFLKYLESSFPPDGKRSRSAVIYRTYHERILSHLRGSLDADKHFRYLVKKSGFCLLDLPTGGLRDVLVVPVKEENMVSHEN